MHVKIAEERPTQGIAVSAGFALLGALEGPGGPRHCGAQGHEQGKKKEYEIRRKTS